MIGRAIGCACALVLGAFTVSPALAQGPPIHTETALLSGFTTAFRTVVQQVDRSGDLPGGVKGDLRVRAVALMAPYAVAPGRLVAAGVIPYVDKRLEMTGPGGTTRLEERGLGDLRLLAEYAYFIRDRKQETTRAIAIGGIELPTGSHGDPDLPPGLWNGSGATNYVLGTAWSYLPPRWGLYTDLIYRITTEGAGVEFGDTLRYDLAFGYRLWPAVYDIYPSPQLNVFVELNGLWEQKSRDFRAPLAGATVPDSGGNRVLLSPGLQYIPGRAFLIEASVQIPVVEELHGRQLETDAQYMVGMRWLF